MVESHGRSLDLSSTLQGCCVAEIEKLATREKKSELNLGEKKKQSESPPQRRTAAILRMVLVQGAAYERLLDLGQELGALGCLAPLAPLLRLARLAR
jgi:hypothetical protein